MWWTDTRLRFTALFIHGDTLRKRWKGERSERKLQRDVKREINWRNEKGEKKGKRVLWEFLSFTAIILMSNKRTARAVRCGHTTFLCSVLFPNPEHVANLPSNVRQLYSILRWNPHYVHISSRWPVSLLYITDLNSTMITAHLFKEVVRS